MLLDAKKHGFVGQSALSKWCGQHHTGHKPSPGSQFKLGQPGSSSQFFKPASVQNRTGDHSIGRQACRLVCYHSSLYLHGSLFIYTPAGKNGGQCANAALCPYTWLIINLCTGRRACQPVCYAVQTHDWPLIYTLIKPAETFYQMWALQFLHSFLLGEDVCAAACPSFQHSSPSGWES